MTSSTNSGGYQNIQVLPFLDDKHIFNKLRWFPTTTETDLIN